MPLFNYQCKKCEHIVEKFQHSCDTVPEIKCEECDSTDFERLLSALENRTILNARDNLSQKILPDANRIMKDMKKGKDRGFLDVYGEK